MDYSTNQMSRIKWNDRRKKNVEKNLSISGSKESIKTSVNRDSMEEIGIIRSSRNVVSYKITTDNSKEEYSRR